MHSTDHKFMEYFTMESKKELFSILATSSVADQAQAPTAGKRGKRAPEAEAPTTGKRGKH